MYGTEGRGRGEVEAGGFPTPEVGKKPAGPVGVKGSVEKFAEKSGVVDRIEGFREVYC